jgi:hypothetical protein
MTLIAYVVQHADERENSQDSHITSVPNTDPEQGNMPQVIAHSFAGMEDKIAA